MNNHHILGFCSGCLLAVITSGNYPESMPEDDGSGSEEPSPQHSPFLLFLLVLVFFVTGLVGILICHVLKEKGYRCRTAGKEKDPEIKNLPSQGVTETAITLSQAYATRDDCSDDSEDLNDDTVEQIVKCIIHNEANLEALKEMLVEQQGKEPAVSRISPVHGKLRSVPSHHHTVHLGSTQAPCMHCIKRKKRSTQQRCRTRESRGHIYPGEVTVFSVGRFRVTHIGKKPSIPEQDHVPGCSGNVEEVGIMQQSNTCGENSLTDDISNSLQADTPKDERVSNGTLQMEIYKNGTGARTVSQEEIDYKATECTADTILKTSVTDKSLSSLSTRNGETLMKSKETNHSNSTLSEGHGNVRVLAPSSRKLQNDLCKDRKMQTGTETNGTVLNSDIEMEEIIVVQHWNQNEDENEKSKKS
ncbi:RELT-like protein 2 isoform X2 [Protopterus annectens]|uniref:RELT-like protein 2 isoform X2 n=1 Tax=Protopterus annectens TaxID=7888 RepID=UPI001CFB07A5|nr:RELT-like protein 2 isoform X2 [Protopterus annectens]